MSRNNFLYSPEIYYLLDRKYSSSKVISYAAVLLSSESKSIEESVKWDLLAVYLS